MVDGRRARAARTRDAIVGALLELVAAGQPAPTAAELAARAGVSARSIAVHFPTRAALFAAAAGRYHERPAPPEPPATEPAERRLAALLATRAVELEASRPIRAAAARLAGEFAVAAEALATSAQRRRDVVARVFAPELARGGGDLLEILDLLLGGRVWDALRERGLAVVDIRRLLGDQVRRALDALAAAPDVDGAAVSRSRPTRVKGGRSPRAGAAGPARRRPRRRDRGRSRPAA